MKKFQFIIISSMLIIIIGLFVYYLHYQKVKDDKTEEERIVMLEEKIQPIRRGILEKLIFETILAETYFRKKNTYANYVFYKKDDNLNAPEFLLKIERADDDSLFIRIISTNINPRNKKLIEYLAKVGHGNNSDIIKVN